MNNPSLQAPDMYILHAAVTAARRDNRILRVGFDFIADSALAVESSLGDLFETRGVGDVKGRGEAD